LTTKFLYLGIGLILFYNLVYNYVMTHQVGPGHPSNIAQVVLDKFEVFKKCKKCHGCKPIRSHHCWVCNRCILQMDRKICESMQITAHGWEHALDIITVDSSSNFWRISALLGCFSLWWLSTYSCHVTSLNIQEPMRICSWSPSLQSSAHSRDFIGFWFCGESPHLNCAILWMVTNRATQSVPIFRLSLEHGTYFLRCFPTALSWATMAASGIRAVMKWSVLRKLGRSQLSTTIWR
jgi:hypothetical protein